MKASQRLQIEQSERREKINAILAKETLIDEERGELSTLTGRMQEIEVELRAAITAEGDAETQARQTEPDTEQRERVELRSKAKLTEFLQSRAQGRAPTGAEAELQAAAGVTGIPLELWDVPRPSARRASAHGDEHRAITPAPGSVGVNLDPIRPVVFANSIAVRLGIDMPRVMSGTFATGTITTSQSGESKAKSGVIAGAVGAITVTTATPKRISARLELTLEDIAAVGQENFEAVLRENLSLALSDELDNQVITGAGAGDDLTGIFERLTNPGNPATGIETWARFLAIQSGGIDGLWATELAHIGIVCNPETYRLAAATFQGTDAEDSAAMYMMRHGAGFWTNKRMPDTVSNISQGILYRMGRSAMGASLGMRTAVCPHWGEVSIDDIYSGSSKAERYFTMHVLLGDVILVQPDAYKQVAFRVST